MPHAVARHRVGRVHRVGTKRQAVRLRIGLNVLPARRQQRAHDVPGARAHPGQPVQPAAAQQVQQQRLRLVVHVVRDGDAVRAHLRRRALQKRIPFLARSRLKRQPLLGRHRSHLRTAAHKRHVPCAAQRLAKGRVGIGFGAAQPMVQMCSHHRGEPALFPQAAEQVQQHDGIHPAGKANEHRMLRQQSTFFEHQPHAHKTP